MSVTIAIEDMVKYRVHYQFKVSRKKGIDAHVLCNFRFKSNNHIKLDNFFFFGAPSIDDKFRSSFRFELSNSIEITPIG